MIILPKNINFDDAYILFVIIVIIAGLIKYIYLYIQDKKQNNSFIKYNYRKKRRKKQSQKAIKQYNEYKNYDPEMFSNEPLDFEKTKNMKYRAYTQAQWDEIKK